MPGAAQPTIRVGGVHEVGVEIIDENGILRTVQRAFGDPAALGDNPIVGAQGAGVRIRVLGVKLTVSGAVSTRWRSATTNIDGLDALPANGGYVLPATPHGWFQTNPNEALNPNLSVAMACGVTVLWCQAT